MTDTLYRNNLPQLADRAFLTDGGIETTLIFHEGIDLPLFAAYVLVEDSEGREALRHYYSRFIDIARISGTGIILESPTWRCSKGWGKQLGHDESAVALYNRDAIELLADLRRSADIDAPIVISGCIGPRGDGYSVEGRMTPDEAELYHRHQIDALAATEADIVTAVTMTYAAEAVGIARAAKAAGIPVAISFTLETDGHLPSGQPLSEAIREVDAQTGGAPAYYMINCAHPDHFADVLEDDGSCWTARIWGLRANASRKSHAELDECDTLDEGDPDELGRDYALLKKRLPNLSVYGGCCGTDHRHVSAIARNCCR
jgi:homocysteine S-methyltransferase